MRYEGGLYVVTTMALFLAPAASHAQRVIFADDFDDGALGSDLGVHDYGLEESGSFSTVGQLDLEESGGNLRISGTGTHDTSTQDGQVVGWIGKAVSPLAGTLAAEPVTITTHVDLASHSTGSVSAGDAGYIVILSLEFDDNNRILFNVIESRILGTKYAQINLDEGDSFLSCASPTAFCSPHSYPEGELFELGLHFDPESRQVTGSIDGVEVLQRHYGGRVAAARVAVAAGVRTAGDTLDVRFDDLLVTGGPPPEEPFAVKILQTGPHCASVIVRHSSPIAGGEVGIAYDPTIFASAFVRPGRDLPESAAVQFRDDAPSNCDDELGVARGITASWINSLGSHLLLPPGEHEALRLCFVPAAGVAVGTCSKVRFVPCLGVAPAPVRNVVTDDSSRSVALATETTEVCIRPEPPFQRGDANADGQFDISDPVAILGCLFIGTDCGTCADAADANDDGLVNIADPVYLLSWRFITGSEPPAPFPACGGDASPDGLEECSGFQPCG